MAGEALTAHWLLFPAVLVGGLIGSGLGSGKIDPKYVRIVTALLILYVAVRLAMRFYGAITGAEAAHDRPLRPRHHLSAAVGDRPLRPALRLLHARAHDLPAARPRC